MSNDADGTIDPRLKELADAIIAQQEILVVDNASLDLAYQTDTLGETMHSIGERSRKTLDEYLSENGDDSTTESPTESDNGVEETITESESTIGPGRGPDSA